MTVGGDFRIQARDNNGDFGVTSARVWIESDIRLTVCGDFYTQTTNSGTFGGGSSAKPSIFELHGDFYQIGTNTFFRHTNNGHITVFAGGGGQHVSFDKKDSAVSLGTVRVDSSSRSQSQGGRSSVADIIFEDYLPSMSIGSNMVIAKSVNNTAETLYLNGYTVTFKSTANLGNVILGGGKLICERQLILNGTLNLGGGLLSVTEDVILNGNGTLGMANVSDVVYIGGNLLINRASNITTLGRGLIDIKGDIRIAASNFNLSTGTLHYFRFSGTAPQKIVYYTNASVYLWNLDAPNPQHVIVTRGNISRYLDGTYVSGTCSNTNCTTTATCNNCKHIEIYKHPFDYSLELAGIPPNNRIVLGETWDELDLLSKPYNASYPGVVWRTDSAYVADIDPKTGKITANNVGGTAIRANSVIDGSLIASFLISVVHTLPPPFTYGVDYKYSPSDNNNSPGYYSSTIAVKLSTGTIDERNGVIAAMTAWTNSSNMLSITEDSNSNNTIEVVNWYWGAGYMELGKYEDVQNKRDSITLKATEFTISLHRNNITTLINRDPYFDNAGYVVGTRMLTDDEISHVWKSIFAHEIGHAFGLDDILHRIGESSIMRRYRSKLAQYEPEEVDIFGAEQFINHTFN